MGFKMKRYKLGKWGQLPLIDPEEGSGRWTVRSVFLYLMVAVLALMFIYVTIADLVR
jgi:hypothetical protein